MFEELARRAAAERVAALVHGLTTTGYADSSAFLAPFSVSDSVLMGQPAMYQPQYQQPAVAPMTSHYAAPFIPLPQQVVHVAPVVPTPRPVEPHARPASAKTERSVQQQRPAAVSAAPAPAVAAPQPFPAKQLHASSRAGTGSSVKGGGGEEGGWDDDAGDDDADQDSEPDERPRRGSESHTVSTARTVEEEKPRRRRVKRMNVIPPASAGFVVVSNAPKRRNWANPASKR